MEPRFGFNTMISVASNEAAKIKLHVGRNYKQLWEVSPRISGYVPWKVVKPWGFWLKHRVGAG